ncbi:MAG: thioredoxin [Clostridia bacterium]|jgi:thioredoxin 1|nr:thioredoxin [Clostridia bacterium]
MATELNQNNFNETIGSGKVIVDFWAPWCGPCRAQAPILETLEAEAPGVKVAKVNVDDNEELAMRFGVRSIPTLIVFEEGEQKAKAVGTQSLDELKRLLNI